MEEKKTHLRVLFEESMKAPTPFTLFGAASNAEETVDETPLERQGVVTKRTLTQVFLAAEAELKRRWPEPVGKKFVRSEEGDKAKWQETKERLKAESKKRLKEAQRKGMAKPALAKRTKAASSK